VIEARRLDGHIEIAVSDNGPGVPAEHRETIFERFRQLARPVDGTAQGTGLGLPICRRIVAQHGGRIWVEDAPGGGARFVVVLPETPGEKRETERGDMEWSQGAAS
jgi:signal transduction histidine kinase